MKLNFTNKQFKPDIVWNYWAATTVLIVGALGGLDYWYEVLVAVNIFQVIHFALREKSLTTFPVELRITYLALLLLSQAPYMIWVLWIQLIGTTAMVIFNYCFLARCLALTPWRKTEKYSVDLIKRTFLTAPVDGSVLDELPVGAN